MPAAIPSEGFKKFKLDKFFFKLNPPDKTNGILTILLISLPSSISNPFFVPSKSIDVIKISPTSFF